MGYDMLCIVIIGQRPSYRIDRQSYHNVCKSKLITVTKLHHNSKLKQTEKRERYGLTRFVLSLYFFYLFLTLTATTPDIPPIIIKKARSIKKDNLKESPFPIRANSK